MRRDIAHYVACCDTCSRVKIEHQKPTGLLKLLEIPVWKWVDISMDFVVGLPRTPKGNDSVWVIVDRLTKVAHFVPVKTRYATEKLAELYVEHILRLHGAPRSIISDRGPQFVAKFWQSFHKLMGTTLNYSTAFHPQTVGRPRELTRFWRTCYEHVHSPMAPIGRAVCRLQSSFTTTAFKQVFGWHTLRPFTGESAEPR
jgi:hypothetical protein